MGRDAVFPATRASVVARVRSDDPAERAQALADIAGVYYKPVYKHLRLRWCKDALEAEDLAQHFFEAAFEREVFGRYEPTRSRFRTFVRACVDNLVRNERKAEGRRKRGGGQRHVAFDAGEAEAELAAAGPIADVEAQFDREWERNVFSLAVAAMRSALTETGRPRYYEVFERYDLAEDRRSYAEVAAELGLEVSDVNNYLHAARKELRCQVLRVLEQITASEEEFRDEARALLGIEVEPA
jgi:RNA polymerase sigma factor (sigma-70 family)